MKSNITNGKALTTSPKNSSSIFQNVFNNNLLMKIFLVGGVLVLLFFIVLIRTVGLFNNNVLFIFDGARDFLWVKTIVVDHKPILIGPSSGGLQGFFQGVLWYYMLAVPFAISGGNPISGTWFMAIMSTISVIAAFFILKKIMNTYAAFLGMILLGFGSYSVATTKFIWNPYPIIWLMPFYFWGIYLISKRSKWGLYLLSIAQGLFLHFEVIYGLGILPAYIFILLFYLKRSTKITIGIKHLVIALILFALPMLPSFAFDLRHHFLISKSILTTIQTGGTNITHKSGDVPNSMGTRVQLRFNDLITYSFQSLTTNIYMNYFILILLLLGIYITCKKKINSELLTTSLLTAIVIISPFLVFLLLKYSVWGYYWIGDAPLYAMLVAFCLGYWLKMYKKPLLFIILALLLFIIANPFSVFPYWYKGNLPEEPSTFSTQLQVIKTIYQDAHGQPFSVYEQTPPVYDYVYRYLLWWQGSTVYKYIPSDSKQKIVYVVLEDVPADPNAIFFTKNTLHLTTKPVKTIHFGAYPIVEKFITKSNEKPVDQNYFPPDQ
jgi:hypothetical protein